MRWLHPENIRHSTSFSLETGTFGGLAVGALAVGALAVGALAIGALAIGRLAVRRARIGRLDIGQLTVHRIEPAEPRILTHVPSERTAGSIDVERPTPSIVTPE